MVGKRLAILFAFVLLAFSMLSVAAELSTAGTKDYAMYASAWGPVVWLVVLISMLVSSLAFMVGRGFSMREIEVWGKEELYQAVASALILGCFSGFVVIMDETSKAFAADILYAGYSMPEQFAGQASAGEKTPRIELKWSYRGDDKIRWSSTSTRIAGANCPNGNDPDAACHFYLARAFVGSTFEKLAKQARQATQIYTWLVFWDSFSVSGGVDVFDKIAVTIGISPLGGNSIIYEAVETAFTVMVKSLLFLKMQEIALMYIERGIFPILLISGLVLRSVWVTRKVGGLILAIAIGLYTIFPFMYILGWYTLDATQSSYDMTGLEDMLDKFEGMRTNPLSFLNSETSPFSNFDPESILFTEYRADGTAEYYGLFDTAARYAMIAFGMPVINLLVLLGFVRGLSGFIGGDIEIAGITRLL